MKTLAFILVAVSLSPGFVSSDVGQSTVHADTPAQACNSQFVALPMQGHYTGTWQSRGTYHFYVFGKDLELQIDIDGTLDVQVAADGTLSGRANATVDAPITHDGTQDVSSGYGTIGGQVTGVFSSGGSYIILPHPVIDMHWGTFDQGYTVERFITMPDYSLPVSTESCVYGSGTVSETGFPVQNVVEDGTPNITRAPGIGSSTGNWQLASDGAAAFAQLSAQVDAFISGANAQLNSSSLTAADARDRIATPFTALLQRIRQQPDIAACLLERLAAWESTAVPLLLARVSQEEASTDLTTLREAGDLLASERAVNVDCGISDGDANSSLQRWVLNGLDTEISSRSWGNAALFVREALLDRVDAGMLQQRVDSGMHALLTSSTGQSRLRDLARAAFAFGDDSDTHAAYGALTAYLVMARGSALLQVPSTKGKPKKHKKPDKRKRHPKKKPTPKPTATPRPTATPKPPSLDQVLSSGIARVQTSDSGGGAPKLSWAPVAGATRYLVSVVDDASGQIAWTWFGDATSVTFGDVTLPGSDDAFAPAWSAAPAQYQWSVIAMDGSGKISGGAFRVPGT